jgi:hypothetical protein
MRASSLLISGAHDHKSNTASPAGASSVLSSSEEPKAGDEAATLCPGQTRVVSSKNGASEQRCRSESQARTRVELEYYQVEYI